MTLSESLGQKCHPVSHAAPLKRNTPTPFSFLSLSPRQTGVVEKKNGWLCHVGSVYSSHLLYSTHLVDKRGALEQERSGLYHVG